MHKQKVFPYFFYRMILCNKDFFTNHNYFIGVCIIDYVDFTA